MGLFLFSEKILKIFFSFFFRKFNLIFFSKNIKL